MNPLFILIVLLVCSCNKGTYEPLLKGRVSVSLNVSEQGVSKSAPVVDDKLISDINIFFYDVNGMLAFSEYIEYPHREISIDGIYLEKEYSILALANVGNL